MSDLQVVRLGAGLVTLALALPALGQDFTTPRPSPNAKVQQTVGTTELSVSYSRPGVKGRVIWGALVPYGKPWRTGANEATQLTCTDDIAVEGQKLAAGTYAIETVPTAAQWTMAFWKRPESLGALDYDAKYDVLRVTVTPTAADFLERLQFAFDDPTADAVTLNLRWEKLRVPLKITVDTNAKTLAAARAAIAAAKPDDWRTPYRAASWALDSNVVPDETAKWAQAAARVKDNFQTSALLARLAARNGDLKLAATLMKKSIAFGRADTTIEKAQIEGNEKLLAEWTAKK